MTDTTQMDTTRSGSETDKKSSSLNDSTSFDQTSESGSEHEYKGPRMTEKFFKDLFKKEWKLYYRTFELNEKLYLHYKGKSYAIIPQFRLWQNREPGLVSDCALHVFGG